MTTYGVTPQGFVVKDMQTILDEIDADLRAILGDSAGTEPDGSIPLNSMAGQLKVMIADGISGMWDLGEALYASMDPNQNAGDAQDAIAAITGSQREAESFSTVTETCAGVVGTFLQGGRVVATSDTGALFSLAEGTIAAAPAWLPLTPYNQGDVVTSFGNVYVVLVAGTSGIAPGPSTQTDVFDGSIIWRWIGLGTGYVNLAATAQQVGPVGALARSLTVIKTPVLGWNGAINSADAVIGANREDDATFRARREAERAGSGSTTPDAIRARVLEVNQGSNDPAHAPPTACTVFWNTTDSVDANGVPPHSVEVLVVNGTDQDIAQAIWDHVGAGTRTFGNQTSTVTDAKGNPQTVYWTRPTAVPIYVTLTASYDPLVWPAPGGGNLTNAIMSALLTYTKQTLSLDTGLQSGIGLDVRQSQLVGAVLFGPSQTDSSGNAVIPASGGSPKVPGLYAVTSLFIGTAPAPASSADISITPRQVATFDTSRTSITVVAGSP